MSKGRCLGLWKELSIFISVCFSFFSVSFLAQWVLRGPASNQREPVGTGRMIAFKLSLSRECFNKEMVF